MKENNAKKSTALGLLVLAAIGIPLFLFFQWKGTEKKLIGEQNQVKSLEQSVSNLQIKIDNLHIQNEELTQMLSGEKSRLEEVEKQAMALADAEKRLKAKMEETLAQASQERAEFESRLKEQQKKEADSRASLEDKLNQAIAGKDVVISRLKDQLKVEVADKILFSSGSAELLPGGKKVLEQLAMAVSESEGQMIQVAGHTDDLPVRKGSIRFPTNWELSAARALAAVRYLEDVCGVPGQRLIAEAKGPYHPRVPNDSEDNRAKNRRIEILLTPLVATP
ncbi:MAG: OmpA family protein [Candidatus Methylacidiphilales bacterium]